MTLYTKGSSSITASQTCPKAPKIILNNAVISIILVLSSLIVGNQGGIMGIADWPKSKQHAWSQLQSLALESSAEDWQIQSFFIQVPNRTQQLSFELGPLFIDLSKRLPDYEEAGNRRSYSAL